RHHRRRKDHAMSATGKASAIQAIAPKAAPEAAESKGLSNAVIEQLIKVGIPAAQLAPGNRYEAMWNYFTQEGNMSHITPEDFATHIEVLSEGYDRAQMWAQIAPYSEWE